MLGNDISIDDIKSVPEDCEFALESILAEFGEYGGAAPDLPPEEPEEPARPIVMDESDGVLTSELRSAYDFSAELTPRLAAEAPAAPEPESEPEPNEDSDVRIYRIGDILAEAGSLPLRGRTPDAAPESGSLLSNTVTVPVDGETADGEDAEAEAADRAVQPESDIPGPAQEDSPGGIIDNAPAQEPRRRSFGEALAAPFITLLAFAALKKQQRGGADAADAAAPAEAEEDQGPELDADNASKYYAGNVKSLRLRLRFSVLLSVILIWISLGLPVAGLLKTSASAAALLCLILELAVVMLGLDIFTAGIMSLIRMKPSMWSLVSVSCFAAALDAAVTAALGGSVAGFPFCGIAAVSMTFAMAGSLQTCRGLRLSLRALALSRAPYTVTSESGVADDGATLLKSRRDTAGYLRRCEEPDCAENAYGPIALFLLAAVLVLAAAATALSGEWNYFFRILAAITAPCAPFAAFLAFPLPYALISRRIFMSGSAIAGWAGLREIGGARHLIITDSDIFPAGTLSIESVRILEGTWPEKVISCAGSVICASGSGLAPVFTELMRRNNCSIQRVEEFCCHEGGGLTAQINGEEILCGNPGFMHLMGVRLPQKLAAKSSVFVSINGILSGIFTVKYIPVTSVQESLANLLHTRREPIFAIRDFNITPLMIRQKFRMSTDGFDFPTFAKRYEISSAEPSAESRVSAIISREGLAPLVEVSDLGRKLYITVRLSVILSLLCTFVGILLMFSLCLSGSFDSATAGNLLTYMFLWLVPVIVLALGLGR